MRQHIILLFHQLRVFLVAATVIVMWAPVGAALEPPTSITVVANPLTRHVLSIQPGFTLFVVFDAPIEFVAVGDEQVLTIAVRGPGGLLALKANQRTGRTNVHVQAGGLLMVLEVHVTTGGRTADVVRVLTSGTGPRPTARATPPPAPAPEPPLPVVGPTGQRPHSREEPDTPTEPPGRPQASERLVPPTFLTETQLYRVQESAEAGIQAVFQAYRTSMGIEIRYSIRNTSGHPWKIILTRVLARADGETVFPRVQHQPSDSDTVMLADGVVEAGLLRLGRRAGTVDLLFPLFPPTPDSKTLPVLFQIRFDDLQQLVELKTS